MSKIVELPEELESQLDQISASENKPKSDIIKESLELYIKLKQRLSKESPFELGKNLFGRNGSGQGDLSINAESILHKRLNAKEHS